MVDKATRTLTHQEIKDLGRFDNANRWYPESPRIKPYFAKIRAPSRAYPYSYWKAANTKKFANWIIDNAPLLAVEFGLIPDRPYWLVRTSITPTFHTYIEAGKIYVCYDLTKDKEYGFIMEGVCISLHEGCPHLEGEMWEIVND